MVDVFKEEAVDKTMLLLALSAASPSGANDGHGGAECFSLTINECRAVCGGLTVPALRRLGSGLAFYLQLLLYLTQDDQRQPADSWVRRYLIAFYR